VTQGNVKVNGWNRGEIRVVVRDGTKFNFKVQAENASGVPALLSLFAVDMKGRGSSDCSGATRSRSTRPVNATVTVKGKEIHTTVDTIRRATVYIIGGDIILRNVVEGVTCLHRAGRHHGRGIYRSDDPSKRLPGTSSSSTRVRVRSATISVRRPTAVISRCQQLGYRQVEVNSISGSGTFHRRCH
jgi:hypothetical protein